MVLRGARTRKHPLRRRFLSRTTQLSSGLSFQSECFFKPPSIMVLTPNGRFAPNQRLCLSNSDFHPESWNPAWNVGTILCGLVSFMTGNQTTVGSIKSTDMEKKVFARGSIKWNLDNSTFRQLFPTFVPELEKLHKADIAAAVPEPPPKMEKVEETKPAVKGPDVAGSGNQMPRNFLTGKWARILAVAGLAAFAVAVRLFTNSMST
ncbi:hypothetical protein RvY_08947 [Ramazzottius varieornatus]|uniref:UBC core domain-containing protein n=1 Tax=Ramazzottius varieornatus TaxID=947166 RepID=A0A1D1V7P7_RAMVA|nr:hypothetical protein RvY_08947 [Ramazzottius varieornatus]